ncbi:MAG: sodium:solute symporter [Gammaproteobacteria bacterium]|nr:sodium:solute symporter [Gammaproteobacteria bacterium]
MTSPLTLIDWSIVALYVAAVIGGGVALSRQPSQSMRDYFLGGNQMSAWLVMFSVIATTQSAATFLGGPDYGFRGDYTYLGASVGAILASLVATRFLLKRFYELKVTTVYELLATRYGEQAKRAAGGMYLIGRVFASGARVYIAATAVAMMLFFNIEPQSVIVAVCAITVLSLGLTLMGGVRSVIWSDLGQFVVYFGAALIALCSLWSQLPLTLTEMIAALRAAPVESLGETAGAAPQVVNKLTLFDFSLDFAKPFTVWAIFTGLFLLNLGNFGLDQDTTQRLLTCRDAKAASRAMIGSAIVSIPIVFVFVTIGQLLHLLYERPELMASAGELLPEFSGERITVFMSYILSEMPVGVRGLATAGIVAAAISTMTSGLSAMSSVLISDFYRPWKEARAEATPAHYVFAGRCGMGLFAFLLAAMAVLCFYWQRYTDMALLEFALAVMAFAYSGLIGVFFTAVCTGRGSSRSVIAALIAGFIVILAQQSYVVDALGLPAQLKSLSFPWQLLIGVGISVIVCAAGTSGQSAVNASFAKNGAHRL